MIKTQRKHPDYLLRAPWHDYRRPGAYLVTFSASENAERFSRIERGDIVILTPTGEVIKKVISELPTIFEGLQIPAYVIMPDHIHIVFRKVRMNDISLGKMVAKCKSLVTSRLGSSQFGKGFNDKISFSKAQTNTFVNYVNDNPRRYLLRRENSQYFIRKHKIYVAGTEYEAFGNPELLMFPVRSAVRFSRKFSVAEFEQRQEEWEEIIRQGGVLCSPFIHEQERDVLNRGIEMGASIILIRAEGFPERYKPEGRLFGLCVEGRLLIVALNKYSTRKHELTRGECLQMNDIAASLAAHFVR